MIHLGFLSILRTHVPVGLTPSEPALQWGMGAQYIVANRVLVLRLKFEIPQVGSLF